MKFRRLSGPFAVAILALILANPVRSEVPAIVGEYWRWRETAQPLREGDDPIALFEAKLRSDGVSPAAAAAKIETLRRRLIAEEGECYDSIYTKGPNFN